MTAYWERPADPHAIIRAADALVRFAGFRHATNARTGYLHRWEAPDARSRTFVRFTAAGHARIIRTGPGFRCRHVVRCGSYLSALDIERAVRDWSDDALPHLQALATA